MRIKVLSEDAICEREPVGICSNERDGSEDYRSEEVNEGKMVGVSAQTMMREGGKCCLTLQTRIEGVKVARLRTAIQLLNHND